MIRRPPRSTRTDTPFPYTTLFRSEGKQYKVLVQAPQAQRVTPNDLNNIYLRSAGDRLIPLASLVRLDEGASARELNRTDRSEERRVGKECVSTCRSRWSPFH